MKIYNSGCMLCGKSLVYTENEKKLVCSFCGAEGSSNASCEDGHYICDGCHSEKGREAIREYVLSTEERNPGKMAAFLMRTPFINIHGPEHHFLVPAVLAAAYKNSGGDIDLEKAIDEIEHRGAKVPGGICGFWGSCGAAVGAGIFISVVLGVTPLSEENWGLANLLTGTCLINISKTGGPRCCKRNGFTAINTAVDFTEEHLKIKMEKDSDLKCGFFNKNNECIAYKCSYYPQKRK